MGKQIVRTVLIYFFVMVAIVILVLSPRVPEKQLVEVQHINGTTYFREVTVINEYSIDKHWNVIKDFFHEIIENKNLGLSRFNVPVEKELYLSLSRSLTTMFAALALSFVLGLMKGTFDFKMQRRKWNIFGNWTTWLFQSVPDFFIILFVQLLLIRYFPITRFFGREGWDAFVLPALLIAIFPTMYIARITSAALSNQEDKMYILTARAKGLTEKVILFKHVYRNCIGTILTHLPPLMVYVISNLLMVEYFMYYPGAALRLYWAIDYNNSYGTGEHYEPAIILGITFCFMLIIFIVHIISIIARKYVEPEMGGGEL